MNMGVGNGFVGTSYYKAASSGYHSKEMIRDLKESSECSASKIKTNASKCEEQLSEKARDYLAKLREKYGDYDLKVVNSDDDLEKAAMFGGKEFSVLFSSDEIEKMANDEAYATEKMNSVESAIKMCLRVCKENGYYQMSETGENLVGRINKIRVSLADDGSMKIFAELEKVSDKQKERIEKAQAKKEEEKRAEEKQIYKKNPYERDEKNFVKRTTVEASSEEELMEKLRGINWDNIKESFSGDRVSFRA